MEALIRHALSKLNPRNAGFPFEEMANKLINRSIHRQGELLHLPPTGPAGGGDGTSDGRIIRFNSGEHRICCSIDKDPKKKFQKDLKNLKAKGELTRLKAVLCITNKPIKEKDKLQFEKKVSADFKTTIYVLDESWLVLLLSNKDYYDLAIKYLECPDHLIQEQLVLYHYPYPAAPNFTGRSEEKKMLTNWFIKDKKNPILSIVEIGGMGKTALAWRWLQDNVIKKRLKLEGVVWWSFYDEKSSFEKFLDFCIENVIKTDPSARAITQDNVITLKNIKAKDIYDIIKINTDLFIKVTILDKIEMVYKYFQQAPFLLILDGIERMLKDYIGLGSPYKDEEVKDKENIDFNKCIDLNFGFFLRLLANETSKTKTLITTRIHPYELENLKGVKKMDLSPLKPEDAIKYFINMGLKGTRRELKEAATAYGYYPLCLNILAGMVLNDKKYPSDIRQWIKKNPFPKLKGEKQRHHILKLAYNSLNKNQQEMISKIATFRSSIKFEEITLLNKLDNDEVLQELIGEFEKRRFLFQIHDKKGDVIKYDMHPIIKHFCYKQLKNPKKTHLMLHNYFKSISYSKVIKSLDDVQPLIEYYHHTVYAGKYSEAYKIYNEKLFSHIILQFGRHLIEIELLSALFPYGYNNPPKNLRDHQIHDALLNLGKSFSISGQLNYAMEIFKIINENNIAIIKNRFPKAYFLP